MQVLEQIALYMRGGSSDKVYQVQLVQDADGFRVNYQNGRRGKALRSGTKTQEPLQHEAAARKIYDALVASKRKGGYSTGEDGVAYSSLPEGKDHSGIRPQLLVEVDEQGLEDLLVDDNWAAQKKFDGERRVLIKREGQVFGTNREGVIVPAAQGSLQAVSSLACESVVLDGEDMGSYVAVFDLLELNGVDLRACPYDERLSVLGQLLGAPQSSDSLQVVATARSEADKRALLAATREAGQEGVVLKHRMAAYEAGRVATQRKFKFCAQSTCLVLGQNEGKRSVAIGVRHEGETVAVGNVSVPANQDMPKAGDLIDVKYLYAFEGGSLFQPVMSKVREDKTAPDELASLKFKVEDDGVEFERPRMRA